MKPDNLTSSVRFIASHFWYSGSGSSNFSSYLLRNRASCSGQKLDTPEPVEQDSVLSEPFSSETDFLQDGFTASDGATCRSSITPGLSGYIPLFLNPAMMLTGVNARDHTFPTSDATTSLVITLPGLAVRYCTPCCNKISRVQKCQVGGMGWQTKKVDFVFTGKFNALYGGMTSSIRSTG